MVGSRESCSSQNQSENDWVESNQWSAGRQVCYLQDETTLRDNFHARTCIYYSAGCHEQSSRNDGTLSENSSKSFQAMLCLSGHGPTNQSVWPFCQAEPSDHQGKHALGTGKQPLMDGVKEVSGFRKENEMYFLRVSSSFVWVFHNEVIHAYWMLFSSQCWFNSESVIIVLPKKKKKI